MLTQRRTITSEEAKEMCTKMTKIPLPQLFEPGWSYIEDYNQLISITLTIDQTDFTPGSAAYEKVGDFCRGTAKLPPSLAVFLHLRNVIPSLLDNKNDKTKRQIVLRLPYSAYWAYRLSHDEQWRSPITKLYSSTALPWYVYLALAPAQCPHLIDEKDSTLYTDLPPRPNINDFDPFDAFFSNGWKYENRFGEFYFADLPSYVQEAIVQYSCWRNYTTPNQTLEEARFTAASENYAYTFIIIGTCLHWQYNNNKQKQTTKV